MEIKTTEKKDLKIVEIIGDFTSDKVTQFKEKVYPLLYAKEKTIAIDMSQINYIDSTGIGSLVSAMKTARSEKKDFILFDFNTKIKKFFDDVGLKNFFKTLSKEEFESQYK